MNCGKFEIRKIFFDPSVCRKKFLTLPVNWHKRGNPKSEVWIVSPDFDFLEIERIFREKKTQTKSSRDFPSASSHSKNLCKKSEKKASGKKPVFLRDDEEIDVRIFFRPAHREGVADRCELQKRGEAKNKAVA